MAKLENTEVRCPGQDVGDDPREGLITFVRRVFDRELGEGVIAGTESVEVSENRRMGLELVIGILDR